MLGADPFKAWRRCHATSDLSWAVVALLACAIRRCRPAWCDGRGSWRTGSTADDPSPNPGRSDAQQEVTGELEKKGETDPTLSSEYPSERSPEAQESRDALRVPSPEYAPHKKRFKYLRIFPFRRARLGPTGRNVDQAVVESRIGGDIYQIGGNRGHVNIYAYPDSVSDVDPEAENLWYSRQLFRRSIEHRDRFIGSFLGQALRQANVTFILSIIFMAVGGLLILTSGALALAYPEQGQVDYFAIGAGLSGLVVTGSGAAFARRADKARKHLATQVEAMHEQLLDERKFAQVGEILTGIKDPELNDRARIALALKIMNAGPDLPGGLDRPDVPEATRKKKDKSN